MDVEKTMQFILDTQVKHEIAIQQADERFARSRQETDERFRNLIDVSMSLAHNPQTLGEETNRRFQETDYKINALIEAIDKLAKRNGK